MLNWRGGRADAKSARDRLRSITTVGTPFFQSAVSNAERFGAYGFGFMALVSAALVAVLIAAPKWLLGLLTVEFQNDNTFLFDEDGADAFQSALSTWLTGVGVAGLVALARWAGQANRLRGFVTLMRRINMKALKLALVASLTLAAAGCVAGPPRSGETSLPTTRYEGARVFDGRGFVARDLCTKGDRIVRCNGRLAARAVALEGRYVTPPFGDAHTHHFDGPATFEWHNAINLEAGVFYAMTMTAPTSGVAAIRDRFGGADAVDVATSTGGVTGPDSHPAEIYEALAIGAYSYEDQLARADEIRASRRMADDAYFVVETEADVRRKWPLILQGRPDHIKVYLRKSERYHEGYGKWGPGGGVDPALLPLIAELAHAAGLRVAVANSSLADYRATLAAGADISTHLPCYQDSAADPDSPYYDVDVAGNCLLSEEDARRAARKGLISTLITTEWEKDRPADLVDWERRNVALLSRAGARLVLGSNAYGRTIAPGLIAAAEKDFLSPAEVLRLATMETPKSIFPDRKIGCLSPGCEASFLVFSADPIKDLQTISDTETRINRGYVLPAKDRE